MSRPDRIKARNQKIRDYFSSLERKHPQWRWDALLQEAEKEFFLSPRTIDAIIKFEGVYAD